MLKSEPFSKFGKDLKKARTALKMSRAKLAEKVFIGSRYIEKIENTGVLPSLPVFYQLVHIFNLPVEQYFFPEVAQQEDANLQRTIHKLRMCPTQYLSIVEATIDATLVVDKEHKEEKRDL